jgi:DNA-binding transcriptional regulator PaaX
MDMNTSGAINTALKVLGVAGLVGITVVAPNALQGLEKILKQSPARKTDQAKLIKELKRQGLIYVRQDADTFHYTITPAGIHRLQNLLIDEIEVKMPAKWDKKWRLVTFDIPVRQSKQRASFVERLQSLNFVMLQRSLWVHPAPCLPQIEQIASHYNVLRYCVLSEITLLDEQSSRRLLRQFPTLSP